MVIKKPTGGMFMKKIAAISAMLILLTSCGKSPDISENPPEIADTAIVSAEKKDIGTDIITSVSTAPTTAAITVSQSAAEVIQEAAEAKEIPPVTGAEAAEIPIAVQSTDNTTQTAEPPQTATSAATAAKQTVTTVTAARAVTQTTIPVTTAFITEPPAEPKTVLSDDGTDYGKAKAVFKWMTANGHGSCVYYSMETYFVCKGIGLECAYSFATDNGWYGHTYSVVKVNGTWYIMDTQAELFLDNNEPCTRMFDGNDNDLKPFKPDIWYDYDENGEYRNWTISD